MKSGTYVLEVSNLRRLQLQPEQFSKPHDSPRDLDENFVRFDHAQRLRELLSDEAREEVGGIQRQVLAGRETRLVDWARSVTGSATGAERLINAIDLGVRGQGPVGRLIAGDLDLDNIDNVFRLSFHMGLHVDHSVAQSIARAIVSLDQESGAPVFRRSAKADIQQWQEGRRALYEQLMLARRDFAGKLMLLYATTQAYEAGEIDKADWALTDYAFLNRLLNSSQRMVSETASRWIAGEIWSMTPLLWMEGKRPDYPDVFRFSSSLSETVQRPCFAYAIADKRARRLSLRFDDAPVETIGEEPTQWLLGIGSPLRRTFQRTEITTAFAHATSHFKTRAIGSADAIGAPGIAQPWLA